MESKTEILVLYWPSLLSYPTQVWDCTRDFTIRNKAALKSGELNIFTIAKCSLASSRLRMQMMSGLRGVGVIRLLWIIGVALFFILLINVLLEEQNLEVNTF